MHGDDLGKRASARRAPGAVATIATIALVLALSLAISWPLWSLATRYPRAYTIGVGVVLAGLVLAAIIRARRRRT